MINGVKDSINGAHLWQFIAMITFHLGYHI
jgi:hypothetical protein